MQYPGYNTGKVILSEGDWFPFRITKFVQLQDNSWYYVLQDINGLKHFMPAGYYKDYGFSIGIQIKCKIDRINCTGRIFLEPEHPYYQEGQIYEFDLIDYIEHGNDSKLVVKEALGKSIEVPVCKFKIMGGNNGKKIKCLVKNIKKGIPILELLVIIS